MGHPRAPRARSGPQMGSNIQGKLRPDGEEKPFPSGPVPSNGALESGPLDDVDVVDEKNPFLSGPVPSALESTSRGTSSTTTSTSSKGPDSKADGTGPERNGLFSSTTSTSLS